jgi:N-acetylmuramoyl-L-alanine amidase
MNPEWIGCSPHNFRPGRLVGYRPELIVIHVIAGSLLSADRWFNNPDASVSAHYGVGHDGRVHQYVAESDTAFHAGIVVNPDCELVMSRPNMNPNYYAIGIEHEGQPGDPWTDAQAAASAALIAAVAQRWDIPIDKQHVVQHHEIRASKSCPGSQEKVGVLIARAQALARRPALVAPSEPAPAPVQPLLTAPTEAPPIEPVPIAPTKATVLQPVAIPPVQPEPVSRISATQREIRTIASVRVRKGTPSTTAPVANVLPIHTLVTPTGAVIGESIQGNVAWYRDADGNFIWAGGTDAPHPTTATQELRNSG